MNGNDVREWRRIDVDISAKGEILTASGEVFSAHVRNLNPDGLCFTAPDTLRAGDEVLLMVDLKGEGMTRVRLRIVWGAMFAEPAEYRVGAKFDGTLPQEKSKFMRFYHVRLMTSLGG